MKINNKNEFDNIRQTRLNSDVKTSDAGKIAAGDAKINIGADKLQVSNRAAEVGNLVDRLKNLPDVRQERVNALRERIAAGEFNPSSESIADGILKDES